MGTIAEHRRSVITLALEYHLAIKHRPISLLYFRMPSLPRILRSTGYATNCSASCEKNIGASACRSAGF